MSPILPPNQDHEKTPTEKEFDKLHFGIATPNSTTLINDPETTVQPVEVTGQTPERKKLIGKGRLAAIGSGVLALFAVIVFAGTALAKEKGGPTENPGSTISEQSNPASAETSSLVDALEMLPTVESLEMDASLLSDPEALAKTLIVDRFTSWFNAGSTLENVDSAFGAGNGFSEMLVQIPSNYDSVYEKALLMDNWETNKELYASIKSIEEMHAMTFELYVKTYPDGTQYQDLEAYKREMVFISSGPIEKNSDGTSSIIISFYENDNSEMNRAGEALTGDKSTEDNSTTKIKLTLVNTNGKIKIAGLTYLEY